MIDHGLHRSDYPFRKEEKWTNMFENAFKIQHSSHLIFPHQLMYNQSRFTTTTPTG